MGLFGNEEKQAAKTQALLDKYGLGDLSDPRDVEAVKWIATDLAGRKLMEIGTLLQGNGPEAANMGYLHAIVQQNFILIRQLDRLNKNLEK